jgi:hypothetical protein
MSPLFRDLIAGLTVGDTSPVVIEEFKTRDGVEELLVAILE